MKERLMRMPLFRSISQSFSKKIIAVTVSGLIIGFVISIATSNQGLIQLKDQSILRIKDQLAESNQEILKEYLFNLSNYVESQLGQTTNEQLILREITQEYFDNGESLHYPGETLNDPSSLAHQLMDNGRYLQSSGDTTLLVQNYLLEQNRKPNTTTQNMITRTSFLSGLLLPFYNSPSEKLQIYFTGNSEANIYRVAPPINLGAMLDDVYPKHNVEPNWETFYPGLLGDWEKAIYTNQSLGADTPIYMAPSVDGATNKLIISIKAPIVNDQTQKVEGAISYDLSIEQIIEMIERVDFSKNAFAFLSQSNGNVFAINNKGLDTLGLGDAIVQSNTVAFKKLERNFSDSPYSSVRNVVIPNSSEIYTQKIKIHDQTFWVMSMKLKPFKTWESGIGFKNEQWILGFMIPESDFLPSFNNIASNIEQNAKEIILKQSGILLLLFAFIATIIFMIYEQLSVNLTKLLVATEQIKKRNFDVEIDIDSHDEFNVLAQSFNSMNSEIKATVQQLLAQNDLLKNEMDLKIRMDEQIAYMKQYDTLTGLPNKQNLYKKLTEYCDKALVENRIGAVVIVGLDNFKKINEAYGVDLGDELLKSVAERLRKSVDADLVARITGDEFALIFYGMNLLDDLITKLEHLRRIMNIQFNLYEKDIYLTASYGISAFPADSKHPQDLLKYATTAMINAKESSKDHYRFYDSNIEKNVRSKVDLMNMLRHSIEKNELTLLYQPIVDASNGKMKGIEALLRWHNHEFGFIPPSIFIPLAEEIKFIGDIEKWVIHQALEDLEVLSQNNIEDLYVSINLSAIDIDSSDFMDYLQTKFDSLNGKQHLIQLEIAEGVLISHYDRVVPRLIQLANQGIQIALDDFGTGYSSLKYIKRLPLHCLKIDRSFVKDYPNYDDGSIAKIIVNLAQTLNMKVIAEGVETEAQANFLSTVGCTLHQGYLYSKPVTLSKIIELKETTALL